MGHHVLSIEYSGMQNVDIGECWGRFRKEEDGRRRKCVGRNGNKISDLRSIIMNEIK